MAILATAVWRVRAGGSDSNGGGYDSGIASAGTDYSQQNAAQLSGSVGTAAGTTTFTDATATFTAAMIGNALCIASGAGFTAGFYFITARASNTSITLDRSPGTGTVAVWKVGGAWGTPKTNFATSGPLIAGNVVYIRGAGGSFPTTDDYTVTGNINIAQGGATGYIRFVGENGTPRIGGDGLLYNSASADYFENIAFAANGTNSSSQMIVSARNGYPNPTFNCLMDQNGYDMGLIADGSIMAVQCGATSLHVARGTTANPIFSLDTFGNVVMFCMVNDCLGPAMTTSGVLGTHIHDSILVNNGGQGILTTATTDPDEGPGSSIANCTIYANGTAGQDFTASGQIAQFSDYGNLIVNETVGTRTVGSLAANDRLRGWFNWDFYYNNTGNVSGISLNVNTEQNNVSGTNPGFAAPATEGFNIGTALRSASYPGAAFLQSTATMIGPRSYVSPGGAQRVAPGASGYTSVGMHVGSML